MEVGGAHFKHLLRINFLEKSTAFQTMSDVTHIPYSNFRDFSPNYSMVETTMLQVELKLTCLNVFFFIYDIVPKTLMSSCRYTTLYTDVCYSYSSSVVLRYKLDFMRDLCYNQSSNDFSVVR